MILSTLQQCILAAANDTKSGRSDNDRGVLDLEYDKETDAMEDKDAALLEVKPSVLEAEAMSETDQATSAETGFNVNCVLDVWAKGKELIRGDDVKKSRRNEHTKDSLVNTN